MRPVISTTGDTSARPARGNTEITMTSEILVDAELLARIESLWRRPRRSGKPL
jgi:hypothetical protein